MSAFPGIPDPPPGPPRTPAAAAAHAAPVTPTEELLRRLLPRVLWLRDAEDGGGALAALIRVLAEEYDGLRLDVDALYDQMFLATCDAEHVPLIAGGIGVVGLAPVAGPGVSDRAWVGRVIGLRRRKGMLATVGRGATAATGWAAYVQEGRAVVGTTHSVRPGGGAGGVDRLLAISGRVPADLGQPWSAAGRTAAITGRPVVAGEGAAPLDRRPAAHPSPAGVAVSVWRLTSFPVTGRTATPAADAPEGHAGRAFRFDPLGRDTRLFTRPQGVRDHLDPPRRTELPLPLTIPLLGELLAEPAQRPVRVHGCERVVAGDLTDWHTHERRADADAVVDPLRGRLLLTRPAADDAPPGVDYAYGLPGEIGGGPYGAGATDVAPPPGTQALHVGRGDRDTPGLSLDEALARAAADAERALVVIADSATHDAPGGAWHVDVPPGGDLRIASMTEAAPTLRGDLRLRIARGARVELCGLTLHGALDVEGEGTLAVEHCTLARGRHERALALAGPLSATLAFTLVHGDADAGEEAHVALESSLVDGRLRAGAWLGLEAVTALHEVRAATLDARDCLFTARARADAGQVETSHVPAGSRLPRLIACTGAADGRPRFTSVRFGDPAFGQLSDRCPRAIAHAAARGGEPGAYGWLGGPERRARLPVVLHELLPAGIGARLTYVT